MDFPSLSTLENGLEDSWILPMYDSKKDIDIHPLCDAD